MEGEWSRTILGEHVELATGEAFKSVLFGISPACGILLARGDNVKEGQFEWGEKARYWPEMTPALERYLLKEGDVLLGMDGSKVGKNWVKVRQKDLPCLLVQRVARLRAKQTMDQEFLRYIIGNPQFREYIGRVCTGTSIPHISGGQIKSYEIILPPLHEQRAIANVLGTLDDLIELNRETNEILEEMARTLFKSWFVDFDPVRAKLEGRPPTGMDAATAALFPDHFQDSELGQIPKGWDAIPLYNTAKYINGAAFKSDDFSASGVGLPVIKIGELKQGITDQTKWSEREASDNQVIDTGDLVYSWSGSPDTSLDTFLWCHGRGLLNQHIFKVVAPTIAQKHFVYYLLQYLRPVLVDTAKNKQTTGLGHVTVADMKRILVCWPGEEVLEAFDLIIGPIFDSAFEMTLESRDLATLRDTLLPKLLSGEVSVPVAEELIVSST